MMVYQGEYMTNWPLVLAFVTLTILPAILMFVLAQKHIVAGLTAGAVKGYSGRVARITRLGGPAYNLHIGGEAQIAQGGQRARPLKISA